MTNKKHSLFVLVLVLFTSSSSPVFSDNRQEAKVIFLSYQKLAANPEQTDFGKWFRTTASLTAHTCFREMLGSGRGDIENSLINTGLNATDVKKFFKLGFETTGVYSVLRDEDQRKLCALVAAEGFKPYCSAGTAQNIDIVKKKYSYPLNYLVVKSAQPTKVLLNLACAVSFKETKIAGSNITSIESYQNQIYQIHSTDVLSVESAGITTWDRGPMYISVFPTTLPPNYREPSPLNLPGGLAVPEVMATSLTLRIKSLPTLFTWLLVVEPN